MMMTTRSFALTLAVLVAFAAIPARAQDDKTKNDEKPKPVVRPTPRRPSPAPAPVTPKAAPATPAKPAVEVKPTEPVRPPDSARPIDPKTGDAKPGDTKDAPEVGDGSDSELYKCKDIPDSKKIKVTLKPETEFKELVTWAMGFTCQNFIYSSAIAGRSQKVTVIAPSEMTARDAWKLFLVALQTMNLTVIPKGRTMEIVESGAAKEKPIPVRKPSGVPDADQIMRVIIRPEHMSVEDMTAILQGLRSKEGIITPIPNSGVVLVTDYGSSIDKMVEVARELDEPTGAEKIYIVRVQYADATEMAGKLSEIFGIGQGRSGTAAQPSRPAPRDRGATKSTSPAPAAAPAGGGTGGDSGAATPSKVIPDERTNSLIIISSERGYQRILALIKRLDVAIEGGEGRIHVYYLNNADAEELSNTLNGITSGTGARAQAGGARPGGQQGGAPAGGGAGAPVFEGNVRVTHDKPTNSLVIVSSVKDYLSLKEVVKKLDIPRRQVFVEATILEVSLDKTRSMGLAFHGGAPIDVFGEQSLLFAGVQHGSKLTSLALSPSALSGLASGILGPELEQSSKFLGVSIPSFGVMFQLLQTNNDVNILSSPHILTTDNEPAEISVGQNIPYQSGGGIPNLGGATGANTNTQIPIGLFGGFGQIQRHDVVLKMKLTPHINESDQVRFELEQEISDILSENFGKDLGPVWSTRTVKTMITVADQQPVVIGGLMSDKIVHTESKVPLLGDIPILGYLFKHSEKKKIKTNLLILLTPYIIHDQSDLRRIFEKKVRERREFIETFTTFDPRDLQADIDYAKKHGFLETINQAVRMADEDDRLAAEAEEAMRLRNDEGPVEFPEDFRGGGHGGTEPPPPPPPPPAPAPEPRID